MSDKMYFFIISIISLLGVGSFIALAFYTKHLHEICSIISYIANRG